MGAWEPPEAIAVQSGKLLVRKVGAIKHACIQSLTAL